MTSPATRTMGLIGYGAFGRFMAKHCAPHFRLRIHDRRPPDAADDTVRRVDLADAAACDIVVLAVTLDGFEDAARAAAAHVRPGALVVDVASVKSKPAKIMREAFGPEVDLLGLHPMFGPQSGAEGIAGMRCAVCPVRIGTERLARAKAFLRTAWSLDPIDVDADEHDREMARVQALTHFISRGLREMRLGSSPLATRAYEALEGFARILLSDSWALFLTIERDNPHAEPVRRQFMDALAALERRIAGEDGSDGRGT